MCERIQFVHGGECITIVRARPDEGGGTLRITWVDGTTETLDGLWVIKEKTGSEAAQYIDVTIGGEPFRRFARVAGET